MNKEYDAVFIHGQGYSNRPGRDPVPTTRGRLEASAVRTLLRRGFRIDNFVFSGIPFKGQTLSMADVNARAVQRRTGVDGSQMIVDQSARTTSMEVAFSHKAAVTNNWKRVLHLTYGPIHQDQIQEQVRKKFRGRRWFRRNTENIEVDVVTADQILSNAISGDAETLSNASVSRNQDLRNTRRYQAFLDAYDNSDTERAIQKYEIRKDNILRFVPFGDKILEVASLLYRPDPSN